MKSWAIRVSIATILFALSPFAFAGKVTDSALFLSAKYGYLNWGTGTDRYNSDTQSSTGFNVGYRWKFNGPVSLGVDLGYQNFGDGNFFEPFGFVDGTFSVSAITYGVNFRYVLGEEKTWFVDARAGAMRLKVDKHYTYYPPALPVTTGSDTEHHGGMYLGAGFGRLFTENLSVRLELDTSNSSGALGRSEDFNPRFIGIVVEYQF